MFITIVEIWFWIANGQIVSNFDRVIIICLPSSVFLFLDNNLSTWQWIFTKLSILCIDIVEIWFEIANWQILTAMCLAHASGGILSFHVFIIFENQI